MKEAVVLFGHGTVENLDDLTGFVTNIRRGNAPPPELIAELKHRYQAIGGHSPFNDIARALAAAVEKTVGARATIAMRLWHPYAKDVLRSLAAEGVERVAFVPLAQHSGLVYADAAKRAAQELAAEGTKLAVACAPNWGNTPALLDATADLVAAAWQRVPESQRAHTTTIFSAHSLPQAIIDSGDAYEREFRASVEGVVARLEQRGMTVRPMTAFQSQGPASSGGRAMPWLGPDLPTTLDAVKARGDAHALFAPIGFLADHVEVLYDIDIEAKAMCNDRGLTLARVESLNAHPALVAVVSDIARGLLTKLGGSTSS